MKTLEFTKTGRYGEKMATFESVAKFVAEKVNSKLEQYHKSPSGSEYYYLTNILNNDGTYLQIRISNHEILSRTNVACTGGANVDVFFPIYDNDDVEKLEELIQEEILDFIKDNYYKRT